MQLLHLAVLFLSVLVNYAIADVEPGWEDGYFKIVDETGAVQDNGSIEKEIKLKMNENVPFRFEILKFLYSGPSLSLNGFDAAYFSLDNDDKVLRTEKDIDFETKPTFSITVTQGLDVEINIEFTIINLNDLPFSIFGGSCKFIENKVGPTTCKYTVTDDDGIDPSIEFTYDPTDVFEITDITQFYNQKEAELTLQFLEPQDFETTNTLLLKWKAKDSYNEEELTIVINIDDAPDEAPRWQIQIGSMTIQEKDFHNFSVNAIDGDLVVNSPIKYIKLEPCENCEKIEVDPVTGNVTIDNIDRDEKDLNTITFTIVATETMEPYEHIQQDIVLIIQDINDHRPKIELNPDKVEIDEKYNSALPCTINMNDIDAPTNAMYNVTLSGTLTNPPISDFLQITPPQGNRKTSFSISVTDSEFLDFDTYEELRSEFVVKIEATDLEDLEDKPFKTLTIKLRNNNDEIPQFVQTDGYVIEIPETFGRKQSETLPQVDGDDFYAIDKDIGDKVTYEIVGKSIKNILALRVADPGHGKPIIIDTIKQSKDGFQLFDFENQEEVQVSIQATDTDFEGKNNQHSVISQLTIKLIDVNDESPTLTAPIQATTIVENIQEEDAVDIELEAYDADQNADLQFSINWDWASTYAMKNGQKIEEDEFAQFRECFTIHPNKISNHSVFGKLKLDPTKSPDYEKFDTLYLLVSVVDMDQSLDWGTNEAKLTIIINIGNDNDNPPVFDDSTFIGRVIKEHSDENTVIGIVKASDDDLMGDVTYSIEPTDGSDPELVEIVDGEIHVKKDKAIDADPDIKTLTYKVTASDTGGKHKVDKELIIKITDTNDHKPVYTIPAEGFEVLENTPTFEWPIIKVTDGDRDDNYKTFSCRISGTGIAKYFDVNTKPEEGCQLVVNVKDQDEDPLDYETKKSYQIKLIVTDNPDGAPDDKNEVTEEFDITILDENDKAPIVDPNQKFSVEENAAIGSNIDTIKATDKDEGVNKEITYTLLEVVQDVPSSTGEVHVERLEGDTLGVEHFKLNPDNGELSINKDLKSHYGDYTLIIKTEDHGTPSMITEDNEVALIIEKYNFEKIKFKNFDQAVYLLNKQTTNAPLVTTAGDFLEDIVASDQQSVPPNYKYTITFELEDEEVTPKNIFQLQPMGEQKTSLQLKELPDESKYTVTVSAHIADAKPPSDPVTKTFDVYFIDANASPTFAKNVDEVNFDEEEKKVLDELKDATYPEGNTGLPVYYDIMKSSPEGAYLIRDPNKNIVEVVTELKLIDHKDPYFEVRASRTAAAPSPIPASVLRVNIKLNDINNNPPVFEQKTAEGVLMIGSDSSTVFEEKDIKAIDDDTTDTVKYYIDWNTYDNTHGEGLPSKGEDSKRPFVFANVDLGDVKSTFDVTASMTGSITFDILAKDGEPVHDARLPATLNVISDVHLASILFENESDDVIAKKEFLKTTLEKNFQYTVGIKSIKPTADSALYETGSNTEVLAYFKNEETHIVMNKEDIRNELNNLAFYGKLQRAFSAEGLLLLNIVSDAADDSMEETYKIALITVSAISGLLLIGLIGFFAYKWRSLSRRLKKLDNVEARRPTSVQIQLPNANRRATAYNPKFNLNQTDDSIVDDLSFTNSPRTSKKDFIDDDDEDFIGVENNDIFKIDGAKF